MKGNDNMQLYQQGDVLLTRVELKSVPGTREPGLVLATGASTGHDHTAAGEGVALFNERGSLYLNAPNGAEIVHPEHRTLPLPPGNYRIDRVQEYDHFGEQAQIERDEAIAKASGHSLAASPGGLTESPSRRRHGRPVRD
jgi:hypothetical protein